MRMRPLDRRPCPDDAVNGEGEGLGPRLGPGLGLDGLGAGGLAGDGEAGLGLDLAHVADDGLGPLQLRHGGHGADHGGRLVLGLVMVAGVCHGHRGRTGGVGGHHGGLLGVTGGRGGHRGHPGHGVQGAQLCLQGLLLLLLESEPLPPPEQGTVFEHLDCLGVECPVGALARPRGVAGDLDKAVVEAEIVSEGVLPS